MATVPVTVALPIADRHRSFAFYREALGLEAVGPIADDGIPEPLQFAVNDGLRLMLVPSGGFGWTVGERPVAEPGTSECLLGLAVGTDGEVDAAIEQARAAGAKVTVEPTQKPWGYVANFADPDGHLWMVTAVPS
jgi:predicted lactoylglutathione lyase